MSAIEAVSNLRESSVLINEKNKVLPYIQTSSTAEIRARIRFDFFIGNPFFICMKYKCAGIRKRKKCPFWKEPSYYTALQNDYIPK